MQKILMFILLSSYIVSGPVLTKEMIADGMLDGVTGLFKEITGQNDQLHEENCQKEYKKLYERNSRLLQKEREENIILRRIAKANNIKHEEMEIKQIEIRKNGKCTTEYWDYFKATNHELSQMDKENRHIKLLLSQKKINYDPLIKTKPVVYAQQEESVSEKERKAAKEELKRQMGF